MFTVAGLFPLKPVMLLMPCHMLLGLLLLKCSSTLFLYCRLAALMFSLPHTDQKDPVLKLRLPSFFVCYFVCNLVVRKHLNQSLYNTYFGSCNELQIIC